MDGYDVQIEGLRSGKRNAMVDWFQGRGLFAFAFHRNTESRERADGLSCGCLTTIRAGLRVAATDELTAAIKADERLPRCITDIDPHLPGQLEAFAFWQRRLDQELGRTPPTIEQMK